MKKEIIILVAIFLVLTLGMHHQQWLSYPIEHLSNLSTSGAYGIGAIHPIVFTLAVYIILSIPRGIVKLFRRNK